MGFFVDKGETNIVSSNKRGGTMQEDNDYDDYDKEIENLPSIVDIKKMVPILSKIAQKVYDDWDEEDIDTYGGGGICHLIAEEIASYLNVQGVDTRTISSNFEQHVYCLSKLKEGIYSIDIHWSYYEAGGGFSWKKTPNVIFDGSEIEFYLVDTNHSVWDSEYE